jgi:hypothetical protein
MKRFREKKRKRMKNDDEEGKKRQARRVMEREQQASRMRKGKQGGVEFKTEDDEQLILATQTHF